MTPSGDSGGFLTSWSPPLPSVTRTGAPLSKRTPRLPPFFLYQAEDGIRYADVTGVQTCALPISPERRVAAGLYGIQVRFACLSHEAHRPAEIGGFRSRPRRQPGGPGRFLARVPWHSRRLRAPRRGIGPSPAARGRRAERVAERVSSVPGPASGRSGAPLVWARYPERRCLRARSRLAEAYCSGCAHRHRTERGRYRGVSARWHEGNRRGIRGWDESVPEPRRARLFLRTDPAPGAGGGTTCRRSLGRQGIDRGTAILPRAIWRRLDWLRRGCAAAHARSGLPHRTAQSGRWHSIEGSQLVGNGQGGREYVGPV